MRQNLARRVDGVGAVFVDQRVEHLAPQANQHHPEKEAQRQHRGEDQRAPAQNFGRARGIKAHPLRRLDHRAQRGEERGGEEDLRRPAAGGARCRERASRQFGDAGEEGAGATQDCDRGEAGQQHAADQQAALHDIGPGHRAHAADHDVDHGDKRQQRGAGLEGVAAGEELLREDAAGLDLHHDIGHGIEQADTGRGWGSGRRSYRRV